MAGLDYDELEEKLLKLVQQGNRDAFPFWMQLITAESAAEKAHVVHELYQHIEQRKHELEDLLGG